jgi:hypothetical protein
MQITIRPFNSQDYPSLVSSPKMANGVKIFDKHDLHLEYLANLLNNDIYIPSMRLISRGRE